MPTPRLVPVRRVLETVVSSYTDLSTPILLGWPLSAESMRLMVSYRYSYIRQTFLLEMSDGSVLNAANGMIFNQSYYPVRAYRSPEHNQLVRIAYERLK